ncbi:MAG: 4Fe-4S dicluster domain-containing protein [Candidatus Helarchaeota archaeon]|nr:4Fe-4S dicluster domain-containing protein [Candidatus Helarchaeota archaeon]
MSITLTDPALPKVKIRIANDKCKTPMVCPSPCYKLCPQGVFIVAANPMKVAKKWTPVSNETPGDYMLVAPMIPKCVGCMICVEKCPMGALKIKIKPPKEEPEPEKSD